MVELRLTERRGDGSRRCLYTGNSLRSHKIAPLSFEGPSHRLQSFREVPYHVFNPRTDTGRGCLLTIPMVRMLDTPFYQPVMVY